MSAFAALCLVLAVFCIETQVSALMASFFVFLHSELLFVLLSFYFYFSALASNNLSQIRT